MTSSRPEVRGVDVDTQSRCAHYHSALDVLAIKMKCCGAYYACKDCHEALADHPIEVWLQSERAQLAVLCGVCGHEMSIAQYLSSGYACPACGAAFNPGCRKHYPAYFAGAD
ncbi:MAG TPA: CHY zinc finger protein [Terracidiphilus sp.]